MSKVVSVPWLRNDAAHIYWDTPNMPTGEEYMQVAHILHLSKVDSREFFSGEVKLRLPYKTVFLFSGSTSFGATWEGAKVPLASMLTPRDGDFVLALNVIEGEKHSLEPNVSAVSGVIRNFLYRHGIQSSDKLLDGEAKRVSKALNEFTTYLWSAHSALYSATREFLPSGFDFGCKTVCRSNPNATPHPDEYKLLIRVSRCTGEDVSDLLRGAPFSVSEDYINPATMKLTECFLVNKNED